MRFSPSRWLPDGVRWLDGRITTSIKCTNLFNEYAQQHMFGDVIT
jgi:hypothetical protein